MRFDRQLRGFGLLQAVDATIVALGAALIPAIAGAQIVAMPSRDPPAMVATSYTIPVERLASVTRYGVVALPPPSVAEGVRAKSAMPAHAIAFGRPPGATGPVRIDVPAGVGSARVRVSSATARQLRVGVLLPDDVEYSMAAWAPGDAGAVPMQVSADRAPGHPVWSPVTFGDTQELVVSRIAADAASWSFEILAVSHFDAPLAGPDAKSSPFALGGSAACQSDLACVLAQVGGGQQAGVLQASRATVLLVLSYASGTSWTCTGTLINTASYPATFILTSYTCTGGVIDALTTIWFYARDTCGLGGPTPNFVQIVNSGRYLWSNLQADAQLLQLVQPPPPLATYAGWDASPVPPGTKGFAFHHPSGDVIKASPATIFGTNAASVVIPRLGTVPPGAVYVVDWQAGIFEPGSVGGGLFTDAGDGSALRLRGTLSDGRSSCASAPSPMYYIPFHRQFALMQGFLTTPQPPPPPPPEATAAVVEYYWAARDHYFMTADPAEIAALDAAPAGGWVRTGEKFGAFAEPRSGASPICRFYIPPESGDSHFFSAGAECAAVAQKFPTLTYETGSAFHIAIPNQYQSCPGYTRGVVRLWNNRADSNHRYTTNSSIVAQMSAKGYVLEGTVMCTPHDPLYIGEQ